MSDEDFFKWLSSKGMSDKDCKTLSGRYKVTLTTIISYLSPEHCCHNIIIIIESGITPSEFLLCDTEDFDDIGLTKFGKKRLLKTFTEVKGTCVVNQSQVNYLCTVLQ